MKFKVLEIGAGKKTVQANIVWEGSDVTTLDINPAEEPDLILDCRSLPESMHNQYDKILANHVLQIFPYPNTAQILMEWAKCLKPVTGELHVIVFSLEYICKQILSEEPSPIILPMLYGNMNNQYNFFQTAFTIRHLRGVFEKAGLGVTVARSAPIKLDLKGKEWDGEQHYLCGIRKEVSDG